MSLANIFLQSACDRFAEQKFLGDGALLQLSGEELLLQPGASSNSIAIIIQHLHGNMLSRWTNFLTEDGEKPWRKRDDEFEIRHQTKEELVQLWSEGWAVCLNTLNGLTEDDLLKTITIRTRPLVVVDAINRQLAHYSYHVGQLVYLGKWLKGGSWQTVSIVKGGSAAFNTELKS